MTKEKLPHSDDGSFDYMLRSDGSIKDLELFRRNIVLEKFTPDDLETMRLAFATEYLSRSNC